MSYLCTSTCAPSLAPSALPAWLVLAFPARALAALRAAEPAAALESDEACMARYIAGDPRAFERLYARYRARLHRYALRLAATPGEAEELFQEVWMAVIQGRAGFRGGARFASWLFAIAHRRAADRWRALARHAPDWRGSPADVEDCLADVATDTPSPDRHSQNLDLSSALQQAVAALPLPQREAFLLQAEGELSLQEIATITGCPRETVKSRLRYASQRLRLALEPWR